MGAFILLMALVSATSPALPSYDGGALVINEIMIEPLHASSAENGQWIELYNNSSSNWINLSEWCIENGNGQVIEFSSILIPPRGYFLIGSSAITSENGNYTPDAVWQDFHLSTHGSLLLTGNRTDSQDFVSWNESWDLYPGASLERINPGWAANDRESWTHSIETFGNGDMGTPGIQNSVYSDGFGQNTWAFIKAFVN